jgi:hypothetical protein
MKRKRKKKKWVMMRKSLIGLLLETWRWSSETG